jgi:hypothetical protein
MADHNDDAELQAEEPLPPNPGSFDDKTWALVVEQARRAAAEAPPFSEEQKALLRSLWNQR